mmetsp:Transcript_58818/g.138939  ORF Transcript_58818/g.138939 Transcript_58818/m.138939 type:complete len:464 (+) Transcript_58818:143-1534(+)
MVLVDPQLLVERDGRDDLVCGVCNLVLQQPNMGCPEGHSFCQECYLSSLASEKACPTCHHPTDETRLMRNRPLENLIAKQQVRCAHSHHSANGDNTLGGALGGGVLGAMDELYPSALKRSRQNSSASVLSTVELQQELSIQGLPAAGGRELLLTRVESLRGAKQGLGCGWVGAIHEFEAHRDACLWEVDTCGHEGCEMLVPRREATSHATTACLFRTTNCGFCQEELIFWKLEEHQRSCPAALVRCPNEGCPAIIPRPKLYQHRAQCVREKVPCPWQGCRMHVVREGIKSHMVDAAANHLQLARDKMTEQHETLQAMEITLADLQKRVLSPPLTTVFDWAAALHPCAEGAQAFSPTHVFGPGLEGRVAGTTQATSEGQNTLWIGFEITNGFRCGVFARLRVLDGSDHSVMKEIKLGSTEKPQLFEGQSSWGEELKFSEDEWRGALRIDGTVRIRAIVHIYLDF